MNQFSRTSKRFPATEEQSKNRTTYFPFKQGYPFVATLRVGSEGIQMTVDGKHITSFSFREVLPLIFSLDLIIKYLYLVIYLLT